MIATKVLTMLGEDPDRYRIALGNGFPAWAYPKNGNGVLLLAQDMRSYSESLSTVGYRVYLFKGTIKERTCGILEHSLLDRTLLGRALECVLCRNLVLEDAETLNTDRWRLGIRYAAFTDPYCDACLVSRLPFYDGTQIIVPRSVYSPRKCAQSIVEEDLLHRLLVVSHAIERQKEEQPRRIAILEEALF